MVKTLLNGEISSNPFQNEHMLLNKNPLKMMKGAKSVIIEMLSLTKLVSQNNIIYKIKLKIMENYMIFDVYHHNLY